jgi:excinuclease UvrABC nuclease subunit
MAMSDDGAPPDAELTRFFEALLARLRTLNIRELAGVRVDGEEFVQRLPDLPAVYFLLSDKNGLLYVGKANNVRKRWAPAYWIHPTGKTECIRRHDKLEESIALGDVTLHWWSVSRPMLAMAESLLIQIYAPPWNSHRC